MIASKEAISDLVFGINNEIQIEDIHITVDGDIMFSLEGDNLPDECEYYSFTEHRRQVRVRINKEISLDGKPYPVFTHEILPL